MSFDFSLDALPGAAARSAGGRLRVGGFDRAPQAGDLILRHDVDLSLDGALTMAEAEAVEARARRSS